MISLNLKFAEKFIQKEKYNKNLKLAEKIQSDFFSERDSSFTGWLNFASKIKEQEIEEIENMAYKIRSHSKYVLLIGIGGSYLGARSIIESTSFFSRDVQFFYAGYHLDEDYHRELFNFLSDKNFSIVCISKSGSTLEPALAFRVFFQLLQNRWTAEEIKNRIFLITDKTKGNLREYSKKYDFFQFNFPETIGGRYSVVSSVGLFPIAISGISIRDFLEGFKNCEEFLCSTKKNIACQYASLRNTFYQQGKKIELFVNSSPYLYYFSEWWKQLFGESEGKNNQGIFPCNAQFTTDLHSLGQYLQEGEKHFFETFLLIENSTLSLKIPKLKKNLDHLNYLKEKRISEINAKAIQGTLMAHSEESPCITLSIPNKNPKTLGFLMYFFKYSCAISASILGVNPFDQPGVEKYKKNMFDLLKN